MQERFLSEPWLKNVADLPCIHLSSLLIGRPGWADLPVLFQENKLNGKIWLHPCITSRNTLGKFFKLTDSYPRATAPQLPHSHCKLSAGARVSSGEFWQCKECLCGQDMKTALGQPLERVSHLYQVCILSRACYRSGVGWLWLLCKYFVQVLPRLRLTFCCFKTMPLLIFQSAQNYRRVL